MRKLFIIVFFIFIYNGCEPKVINPPKNIQNGIILPNKYSIWEEGKSYKIVWNSSYKGNICIEVLLGGHSKGIINDCKTKASKNQYLWYIPKGFISNFGIKEEKYSKIIIYPKNSENSYLKSEDFTIIAK